MACPHCQKRVYVQITGEFALEAGPSTSLAQHEKEKDQLHDKSADSTWPETCTESSHEGPEWTNERDASGNSNDGQEWRMTDGWWQRGHEKTWYTWQQDGWQEDAWQ